MNEKILTFKSWFSLSFDEKLLLINALNDRRRNECDTRKIKVAKTSNTVKEKKTPKCKPVTIKMSGSAQTLFNSLPDFMKKGFA